MSKADYLIKQSKLVEECQKAYNNELDHKKDLEAMRTKFQGIYEAAQKEDTSSFDEEYRRVYNMLSQISHRSVSKSDLALAVMVGLDDQIKKSEEMLEELEDNWQNALNLSPTSLEPKTGHKSGHE